MDLKQIKIIGGIGAIMVLLFFIPVFGWVSSIAGAVLVLVALNSMSRLLKEVKIFTNYLIATILSFVSVVVPVVSAVALFMKLRFSNGLKLFGNGLIRGLPNRGWMPLYKNWNFDSTVLSALKGHLWIALLVALAIWAIIIVAGYFAKSSLEKVSEKIKDTNFKTAGLLLFIGSILLPFFGVGVIIIVTGFVFEAIGFFSLKENNIPEVMQV